MKVKILKLFITGAVSYTFLAGFGSFCFAMEDDYGKTKTIESVADEFEKAKEKILKLGLSRKEAALKYDENFLSKIEEKDKDFWDRCACNRAKNLYDEACKKIRKKYENSEYKEFAEYIVPGKTDIDDIKSILTTSPDVSFTKDQMEKAIKSIELNDFDKAFGFLIYLMKRHLIIKEICRCFSKEDLEKIQQKLKNCMFEENFSQEVSKAFCEISNNISDLSWSRKMLTKKLEEIKFRGQKLESKTIKLFLSNVKYMISADMSPEFLFKLNANKYSRKIINKFVNDKLKNIGDRYKNVNFDLGSLANNKYEDPTFLRDVFYILKEGDDK